MRRAGRFRIHSRRYYRGSTRRLLNGEPRRRYSHSRSRGKRSIFEVLSGIGVLILLYSVLAGSYEGIGIGLGMMFLCLIAFFLAPAPKSLKENKEVSPTSPTTSQEAEKSVPHCLHTEIEATSRTSVFNQSEHAVETIEDGNSMPEIGRRK